MTNQEISEYHKLITKEGFSKAMKEIDENDFPKTRRIKYYKAVNDATGKAYSPPLLIERAYYHSGNENLPNDFFDRIGKTSEHFKFLNSNGFDVVKTDNTDDMTVREILEKCKREDIESAMKTYDSIPYNRKGAKSFLFDKKEYPINNLVERALPQLKEASNYASFNSIEAEKFLQKLGFDVRSIISNKEDENMDSGKIIFKKLPKGDITGTEIALLKCHFTSGLMDDPMDIGELSKTKSSKTYDVKVFYKNITYDYSLRIAKTKDWTGEIRLIIDSNDPIDEDRSLDAYLCIWFNTSKITKNSEVNIFYVSKEDVLYEELDGKYEVSSKNELVVTNENDKELYNNLLKKANIKINQTTTMDKWPLNQILYGPPGTGKTYKTVTKALRIIGENSIVDELEAETNLEKQAVIYKKALKKFNDQIGKQIEFVTMHQSYSYEDFIEGLRPVEAKNENGFTFKYVPGVFKEICDRIYNKELTSLMPFEDVFKLIKEEVSDGGLILPRGSSDWEIGEIDNDSIKCRTKGGDGKPFTMNKSTIQKYYESSQYTISGNNDGYYQSLLNYMKELSGILPSIESEGDLEGKDERNFVIILDEINRCNISKVFGELITLIEDDKRDSFVTRLPSGKLFRIPDNLYIIGTMNTADKSVSMVDIALRRRFEFEAMYPDLDLVKGDKHDFLKVLNEEICGVNGRGKGIDFQVGHADFMKDMSLIDTLNKKTIPLLMEYYRNKTDQIKVLLDKCLPDDLNAVIKNTGLIEIKRT